MRFVNRFSLLLFACCASSSQLLADDYVETLSAQGHPSEQYFAVAKTGQIELQEAELRKSEKGLELHTESASFDGSKLVAGVVVLATGEVISSALHPLGTDRLGEESSRLARITIDKLKSSIGDMEQESSLLQEQVYIAQEKLRQRAGLQEVSRVYYQIRSLDAVLRQTQLAQEDLERLTSDLSQ